MTVLLGSVAAAAQGVVIPTIVSRGNQNMLSAATDANTITTSSFTPTANSKLFVFSWFNRHAGSPALDPTVTGGSLTWTRLINAAENAQRWTVGLHSAPVGASPSSMTVTYDANPGGGDAWGYGGIAVFDVAPSSSAIKGSQSATATSNYGSGSATASHTSGTLGAACTNGNLAVFCLGVEDSDPGAAPSTPSGWTALIAQVGAYKKACVFYRTDFTGTSVTCSDLGAWGMNAGSILLEMQA